MTSHKSCKLGIMFRREHPPETLPDFSRRAEQAGFDELWVVEDCFYGSGIASAATALASTRALAVGLGIMPVVARNPVFASMEIATLARIYPGRFLPGFGHGVADWMRQVGAFPESQLSAIEEVTLAVRRLLAGKQVTFDGRYVHLQDAQLIHPPQQIPPVSLGVIGPRSLALSGRVADGNILSEFASPAYVSWAIEQIKTAIPDADPHHHHITVFAWACAEPTASAAYARLRPMMASAMASGEIDVKLEKMGILPKVREYRDAGGKDYLEARLPDSWIARLAIAGTPADWSFSIDRLVEAGAESIVLVPLPEAGLDELEKFAENLAAI